MRAERTTSASPRAILVIVAFGVFVAADDLTVVSTMLRPIIGDLGIPLPAGLDKAAWIVNAYLVAYVAVMPIAGRLSDVVGRRRVFVGALGLFLVGSIWVPLASSYETFLLGRILSAIGGGAMVPVAMAVVGDVYPKVRRATALGTLAAIDTLGWVWGPLYGALVVRFLTWEWQFWLNIPLALAGIAASWWALADVDPAGDAPSLDWRGAIMAAGAITSLNIGLLSTARIQGVTGLEELTGSAPGPRWWLFGVAAALIWVFVWWQKRVPDPLIDLTIFSDRLSATAMAVNFLTGAALVIAMVNVPLLVNVLVVDLERSAVVAGWLLTSLTAAMALTSYAGGRLTDRTGYRPAVVAGLVGATIGYFLMGTVWTPDTTYGVMAIHLALLGAGIGLVSAPVSAAIIDRAPASRRGTAAGLVIVFRLFGLSVGLSGLTAWGLHRFNQLRGQLDLPPISDPGYNEALRIAQETVTTTALTETFVAAAVVAAAAIVFGVAMRSQQTDAQPATPGIDA